MPDDNAELWGVQHLAQLTGMRITNVRGAKSEFGPDEKGIDVVFDLTGRRFGAQHTVSISTKAKRQLDKIDGEFGLQQRVAAAPDRLVQYEPVKSFGPGVPEFDRPIQTPREHRFIGQCKEIS